MFWVEQYTGRFGGKGWQALETEKFTIFGMIQRKQERGCQREKELEYEGLQGQRRATGLGPESSEESRKGIEHGIKKVIPGFRTVAP